MSGISLLKDVPDRVLTIVDETVQRRTFDHGDVLFREGDVGEAVYLLSSGTVKLSKVDLGGHEKTLALMRAPDFFGEMALLGEGRRTAAASAVGAVEAYLLFADDFRRLLEEHPSLAFNVTRTLSRRLHVMAVESQILSYQDAQGRVAYVLLGLADSGVADRSGAVPIVRLTHQELANLAGTSRETVTRALRALEDEGVVATRPKEILLVDANGLEEILHGIR